MPLTGNRSFENRIDSFQQYVAHVGLLDAKKNDVNNCQFTLS